MRVNQEVMAVLSAADVSGNNLFLRGTLDRKLYQQTAKVLEAAGGKWNRKAQAHVFEADAGDAIEQILLTGEIICRKTELQAFFTPDDLAQQLVVMAGVQPGHLVLEPSAGVGAIAKAAERAGGRVECYDIDQKHVTALTLAGFPSYCDDFLTVKPIPDFDRVVMNPPFTKQQDIRHVTHALGFLKPGGLLAAIMSASVMYRTDARTTEFGSLVRAQGGSFIDVPEGAFKESGTMVKTCIVTIPKPTP